MGIKATFTWQNNRLPDIQKRLPAAATVVSVELANRIASDARAMAPVLTGALRDSIDVTSSGEGAEVVVGVEYAPYVEYGHLGVPPQPFLTPAGEMHRNDSDLASLLEAQL